MNVLDVQAETTEKANTFAGVSVQQKRRQKRGYLFAKRLFDIVLSLIGLAIGIVPMLFISLAIVLESPGPAIYLHHRVGKNGKPLALFKFRSMFADADEMVEDFTPEQKEEWERNFKLEDDPRITKVGKFLRRTSLDELPQLVNVLIGGLSIVGPRPVVQKELEKYGDKQDVFLSVTPGLTGYWQAYARSSCSYEKRMEMELHYVENASFWWDVKIFFATFGAVIRGDGAR
ncbi:MAG: sugar transferase [Ruminococcaceae bacterium]|nr:sugar transferase [Oscillospiraceae bacterium]